MGGCLLPLAWDYAPLAPGVPACLAAACLSPFIATCAILRLLLLAWVCLTCVTYMGVLLCTHPIYASLLDALGLSWAILTACLMGSLTSFLIY